MAITVGDLVVRLRADAKQFASTMTSVSKRMQRVGSTMSAVGAKMTLGISAPLALIGAKAAQASMQFETSFAHIRGLVGASEETITQFSDAIGRIGPVVGKTGSELAKASFFITSAGLKGERAAAGIEALEAAAMGATAGLGDTATVADAATSAMNAYGEANLDAKQAVAILVATVREGKAEAASIAPVLGRLMPIAAELGVGFDQVGAALAAMTRLGFDAATSATSIRATMVAILKPAKQSADALEEYGLSFADLRVQLREKGLIDVLRTLKATFGENEDAMARVFPNVRALSGILGLVGANAEEAQGIFDRLATTTEDDLNKAFKAVEETARLKLDRAMAEMSGSMRKLGDVILPVVIPQITKFANAMATAAKSMGEMSPAMQKFMGTAGMLAVVMAPLLIIGGALVSTLASLFAFIGKMVGAFTGATAATGVLGKAMASLGVYLTTAAGMTAVVVSAVVALGAAIGVLIGNWVRPWINEQMGLNKVLDLTAEKVRDLGSGLAENEESFELQLDAYQKMRYQLGLMNREWEISGEFTEANARKLSALTEKAIAYARESERGLKVEKKVANAKKTIAEIQEILTKKLTESEAAHKRYIETLREKYDLQSKDTMLKNLQLSVKEYNALKEAGQDMNELSEAFSQQLVDQVELAKQNKVELPEGVKRMAAELAEANKGPLKKTLQAIGDELPKHVNAMPGKIIPGMVKVGNEIAKAVEGGFEDGYKRAAPKSDLMAAALATQVEDGIELGVKHGEGHLQSLRDRQEAEVMTVKVVGDWSEFDEQAKYRSTGYVPETGAP
jgi:TP901 family phage tail tape measure protein